MDFNDNIIFQSQEPPMAPNGFARASRILGFVSIAFGLGSMLMPLFAVIPLMTGMLSIAFGIVSKGRNSKLHSHAVTGIICSSVTLAFLVIVAVFLLLFFNTAGGQQIVAEAVAQYSEMMKAYSEFYGY